MSCFNYSELLTGIQGIILKNVDDQDEDYITIEFELARKRCECPRCHRQTDKIHDYRLQKIKDTGIQGKKTILLWHKRRYKCSCGKQFYEPSHILARYRRMTRRKEFGILEKAGTERSYTSIAREEGISTSTVLRLFDTIHYARPRTLPEAIGIDEFKGNTGNEKYNCILTDLTTGKPIDILRTRKEADLIDYFKQYDRSHVKYFVSDMYTTYSEIAQYYFPNATYVIDKYHWIRQCTWAFENVRKKVQKKYTRQYRLYFKHSKRLLLKRNCELTDEQQHIVSVMLNLEPHLSTAYFLKEQLYDIIYSVPDEQKAQCLKEWIEEAQDKEIPEFSYCARTYRHWFKPIVNSFFTSYTNGPTEGCNNKIKVLKRIAYGFHSFKRFRNRILYVFDSQ